MKKTILIADDAQSVVKLEEILLKRTGCRIITAYDGFEALKKIQQEVPDVVLLDYAMPGMTGESICRVIKSRPELAKIRVIIVTAKGEKEIEERCRRAGCDAFLRKPLSFKELVEVVSRML